MPRTVAVLLSVAGGNLVLDARFVSLTRQFFFRFSMTPGDFYREAKKTRIFMRVEKDKLMCQPDR